MAIIINIGMWFERFDIIVINLSRGHLPSTWGQFSPTFVDIGIFVGTIVNVQMCSPRWGAIQKPRKEGWRELKWVFSSV